MKKIRIFSLVIAAALLFGMFAMPASATADEGELRLISYNIDGLPIASFLNDYGHSPWLDALEIGRQVKAEGFDLLGVQEDFCNYRWIRSTLDAPYFSYNKGHVPAGDGLDFFSQHPIYNLTRVTWEERYGGISYGAMDEYTPKGFLYGTMELATGVYVDIYTLHANARDKGEWDVPWDEATLSGSYRRKDFAQLSAYIETHSAGRAVIVLGDFNTVLWKVHDGLHQALLAPNGLKDTWAEVYNGGKTEYTGGDWGDETFIHRDRILFRSGTGVEFRVTAAASRDWVNAEGRSLADHASWTATLSYSLTGETEELFLKRPRPMPPLTKLWGYVKQLGIDVVLLVKELPAILGLK